MTILIEFTQLFSEYLGKTRGGNSLDFRLHVVAYARVSRSVSCSNGHIHCAAQRAGWAIWFDWWV